MTEFLFQFDTSPVLALLKFLELGLADRRTMHELLVIRLQQRIYRGWGKGWPGLSDFTFLSRTGSIPLSDKGFLKLSLTGQNPSIISTSPGSLNEAQGFVSTIGTNVRGARKHNDGGETRPVRARLLALPATKEAKKVGSPLNFPRDLFFVPARSGTAEGWWAERRGRAKNAELRRQYLLTKGPIIEPPRPFFPTKEEAAEDAQKVGNWYLGQLARGQKARGGPQ